MIDIHTHILPGLDDGPRTAADSLAMARVAVGDGIKRIAGTPHVQWSGDLASDKILDTVESVNRALAEEGLDLSIVSGAELALDPSLSSRLREKSALTLNGGRYVLVELPFADYPPYADQTLFELQVGGYVPVLAHPERVGAFLRDIKPLIELAKRGVLMQVTAESLTGGFGSQIRSLAEMMLRRDVVHVIASDAHAVAYRPPTLRAAVERAAKIVGEERALAMVTSTPEAILDDKPFDLPEPKEYQPPRLWQRWR